MKLLNKVKISLLISVGVMSLLAIKSFAVNGVITEITVNMRKEPSTDSKKIMYVTQDDVVEVLEKDGQWYKIKFKGKTGYVFGEYVKVDDSKVNKKDESAVNKEEKAPVVNDDKKEEIKEEVKQEEINQKTENVNLIIKNETQIRIIPNISSSVIYTASKDIEIDIVEQLKDWSYIAVDGLYGWVRTDKIVEKNAVVPDKEENSKEETKKEENKESTEIKKAYIKYDTVNLREKASTSAKILAKLKLNEEVSVIEKTSSKWTKVKVDGKTGYISADLLADEKQEVKKEEKKKEETTTSRDGETTSREEQQEVKEDSKKENVTTNKTETQKQEETKKEDNKADSNKVTGEDIVAYAKKYLGCDYVYGGTSPTKGFDCSGFTYYVYKHFGYTLSRSSKAQAKNGKEVSKSELKPGDLILYKNQSLTAIGHVGIYIGDNKIIHASEPGVGVVITDINSKGYNYAKRYVTARRIIE